MRTAFFWVITQRGDFLQTFRDNLSVPSPRVKNPKKGEFLTLDDGTDRLSQNVGKELPVLAT